MKHFFSIGILITSLIFGIFSADFSVVQAQESTFGDCKDQNEIDCPTLGYCRWNYTINQCENNEATVSKNNKESTDECALRNETNCKISPYCSFNKIAQKCENKPTATCSRFNGKKGSCQFGGCEWNDTTKECSEKISSPTARQERAAANDQYCDQYNDASADKDRKDSLKTSCKNDDRCSWSLGGKCNGKASAKTEDFIKCEKAGNPDENGKINTRTCTLTTGCKVSDDQTQCVPENTEGIFDENSNTVYDPFGTYKGPIFDGPGLRAGSRIAKQKLDNTISKERSLKNLIIAWTKFALSIVAVLAVIVLIYAGVLYITDLGDGSNQEKAKKIILYTVIGIIIIFGSYAIVNTVMKARFGNTIAFEKNPRIFSAILESNQYKL